MEIGSEFYLEQLPSGNKFYDLPAYFTTGTDEVLCFLGRTAIDLVINDILKKRSAKKVYMPSYCCHSMIAPFLEKDLDVDFYNVDFDHKLIYKIDENNNADIFFVMNYFGEPSPELQSHIELFRKKGTVIVEDFTHSLFSIKQHHVHIDYGVASIRKWFGVLSGGIAVNFSEKFHQINLDQASQAILFKKMLAMAIKKEYINGEIGTKDLYMQRFQEFNRMIQTEYQKKDIDGFSRQLLFSYDYEGMIRKRSDNAGFLFSSLENIPSIELLRTKNSLGCPLFLSIVTDTELRDLLQKSLIDKKIYCPKHWPAPGQCESTLYQKELSLICDQRYGINDMQRILDIIQTICK